MNEKKEKKGKKILLSCIAVALVCAISVGSTLALSHAEATTLVNDFETDSITVQLFEPKWDGVDQEGSKTATQLGITELGNSQANGYYSGAEINKNPYLYNNSTNNEYGAIKVTYYVYENKSRVQVTPESFKSNVAQIGSLGANWSKANDTEWGDANSELYYYLTAFATNNQTSSLFSTVTVVAGDSGSVAKVAGGTLTWDKMPKFEIDVQGYAVQSDYITTAQAKIELSTVANSAD